MRGCLYRDTDIDIVNKTGRKPFPPEQPEKHYEKKKNIVKEYLELCSPFAFKGCVHGKGFGVYRDHHGLVIQTCYVHKWSCKENMQSVSTYIVLSFFDDPTVSRVSEITT